MKKSQLFFGELVGDQGAFIYDLVDEGENCDDLVFSLVKLVVKFILEEDHKDLQQVTDVYWIFLVVHLVQVLKSFGFSNDEVGHYVQARNDGPVNVPFILAVYVVAKLSHYRFKNSDSKQVSLLIVSNRLQVTYAQLAVVVPVFLFCLSEEVIELN